MRFIYPILLILLAVATYFVTHEAPNTYTRSDPRFTLLVSQAIVDHGVVWLDPYQDDIILGEPFSAHQGFFVGDEQGHTYNYFPLGPSIISLPIVAYFRQQGADMRTWDNDQLQLQIASVTSVMMLLITYATARNFLGQGESILLAFVATWGSGYISTMGTALWSINYTTVAIGFSLYLLTRQKNPNWVYYLLGVLLFIAFFNRASAATFILVVFLYLLWFDWRHFLRTGIVAGLLLLLFLGWSQWTFGSWLPAYFSSNRLAIDRGFTFLSAVYGNLFSPSRGIFVFSPFLLLGLFGVGLAWRKLTHRPFILLSLFWFISSILLIARSTNWWGGFSFGPRILVENLPALVLLLILAWQEIFAEHSSTLKRWSVVFFLLTGGIGIWIHAYQGLYNPVPKYWNGIVRPLPSAHEKGWGELFDWRYTQFLATGERICQMVSDRNQRHVLSDQTLGAVEWHAAISHQSDALVQGGSVIESDTWQTHPLPTQPLSYSAFLPTVRTAENRALFVGWQQGISDDALFRWSICEQANIVLEVESVPETTMRLEAELTVLEPQEVTVAINGNIIGQVFVEAVPNDFQVIELLFGSHLLQPNQQNRISLIVAEIKTPKQVDPESDGIRYLGVGFRELKIGPTMETN